MIIVVWLTIELTLRVWSAGCRSRYQTWKGRLKFMQNVFCILGMYNRHLDMRNLV
jgi:potassium voltage-gated channel KQT-like subfamily protein 5